MTRTVLDDTASLRHQSYCGAETVAAYNEAPAEFTALRKGCGVFNLPWRVTIRVGGRDRTRWLNGMVTNNIRDLAADRGVYAFLLNPQGHILGDIYVHNFGEYMLIDTDRSQAEKVLGLLKRYIIMDKVELAEENGIGAFAICGPNSSDVLKAAGIELPQLDPLQNYSFNWQDSEIIAVRSDLEAECYEFWSDGDSSSKLLNALVSAGATEVGSEAVELFRIWQGRPLYGKDIRERDLAQETEQLRALNFTKGCYIGQEIVERIRSRGQVHRTFTGFRIAGPLPTSGTKIQWDGRDMGEITSSAMLPANDGEVAVALGYLRRELAAPGKTYSAGGSQATVEQLPFTI
jgi:folate-binding protein YgfZ